MILKLKTDLFHSRFQENIQFTEKKQFEKEKSGLFFGKNVFFLLDKPSYFDYTNPSFSNFSLRTTAVLILKKQAFGE